MRESSPPDAVSATGPNGRPAFGRTEKTDLVGARRARVDLAHVDPELALAEPDARRARRATASANRGAASRRASRSSAWRRSTSACCAASASAAARAGIVAVGERVELGPRRRGPLEQLVVGLRRGSGGAGRRSARAAPRPPRAGPARPRASRGSARSSIADLAQRELGARAAPRRPTASSGASVSSGATARSAAATRSAPPSPLVGRERLERRVRRLRELGDVAQPLALGPQLVLLARLEPLRVGDERAQLVEPRLGRGGVARQLVVGAPRRRQLAPGAARRARGVGRSRRRRRAPRAGSAAARAAAARTGRSSRAAPRRPPRRPRARRSAPTRRRASARRRRSAARARASPRPRAAARRARRAPRRPAGRTRPRRTPRPPPAPISAASPRAPEQQPDRVREDRLPRSRLAGDRVQARVELELGLADQDEVLDAKPPKHPAIVRRRWTAATVSRPDGIGPPTWATSPPSVDARRTLRPAQPAPKNVSLGRGVGRGSARALRPETDVPPTCVAPARAAARDREWPVDEHRPPRRRRSSGSIRPRARGRDRRRAAARAACAARRT